MEWTEPQLPLGVDPAPPPQWPFPKKEDDAPALRRIIEKIDRERTRTHPSLGSIKLVQSMGSDLSVVQAARTSFGRGADVLDDAAKGLISYLMRNRHGTPFEHNAFQFLVTCPVFVSREWFRHRIGHSYNEFSTRYSQVTEPAYIPLNEDIRTQVGKPGAYTFEAMSEDKAEAAGDLMALAYRYSQSAYEQLLANGVAKEVARNVLPLATMTRFVWTCNARSLMHFLSLRNSDQALREIRWFARQVEEMWAVEMPVTAKAFIDNGRVAP